MPETSPLRQFRVWTAGLVAGIATVALLACMYREAAKAVFGFVVIALHAGVAALVAGSFRTAILYSRERTVGASHSLGSRIGMFGLAVFASTLLIVVCGPVLIPLWRAFVTPLLRMVFV